MSARQLKEPLAISLAAQRLFNHNLLFTLIEAGSLSQQQAATVTGRTADMIRDFQCDAAGEAFAEHMALAFEQISADLLGLPKSGD